jgi:hypothetical protein
MSGTRAFSRMLKKSAIIDGPEDMRERRDPTSGVRSFDYLGSRTFSRLVHPGRLTRLFCGNALLFIRRARTIYAVACRE